MTDIEIKLVTYVAQKLEIYMQKNNKTIFSLAKIMNIDRQAFYRIINKKNAPTISSLFTIATKLECSIQELIDENIFVDIPIYESINLNKISQTKRIFIPYQDYMNISSAELFGIQVARELRVYYKINNIFSDGFYILQYKSKTVEIEILSAGTKLLIASIEGKEKRINNEHVFPVAKFYKQVPIITDCFSTSIPITNLVK